jgi:hypothetical protein
LQEVPSFLFFFFFFAPGEWVKEMKKKGKKKQAETKQAEKQKKIWVEKI